MGVACFHSFNGCTEDELWLSLEDLLASGDVGVDAEGCIKEDWYTVDDDEVDDEGDKERFNSEEAIFVECWELLCLNWRGDRGGEGELICFE